MIYIQSFTVHMACDGPVPCFRDHQFSGPNKAACLEKAWQDGWRFPARVSLKKGMTLCPYCTKQKEKREETRKQKENRSKGKKNDRER